jgi:hypothetical protein
VTAVQTWTNNELEDDEICKNSATTSFFPAKQEQKTKKQNKKLHNVSAVVSQQRPRRRRNPQLFSSKRKISYKNDFVRLLFFCACANGLPAYKTSAAKMLVYIQKILAHRPLLGP